MNKFKESDIVYHETDGELLVTNVDENAITCLDSAGDEWLYQAETLSLKAFEVWVPTPGWWLLRKKRDDGNPFPILACLHTNGDWELEFRYLAEGEIDNYNVYCSISLDEEGNPVGPKEEPIDDHGISAAREN